MHHENSHNFSDCNGPVGNLYVSEILGTVGGFKKAVDLHQKFYTDRGYDVKVNANIEYNRDEDGTTEEPSRLVTVVMFPSLEVQNQFMNREITDQDQEDYDSFVEIYNKNTKVVVRKSNCYLN
jgi:outer membrane cobalamin receptor